MSFISNVYAQATNTATSPVDTSPFFNLLPLVLIFAVFYIFLIRPQQKKLKAHENIINSIKRGDEVVTGGGIIGKVSKIEEGTNIVLIEIADNVVVRINRATIIEVIGNTPPVTQNKKTVADKDNKNGKNDKKDKNGKNDKKKKGGQKGS